MGPFFLAGQAEPAPALMGDGMTLGMLRMMMTPFEMPGLSSLRSIMDQMHQVRATVTVKCRPCHMSAALVLPYVRSRRATSPSTALGGPADRQSTVHLLAWFTHFAFRPAAR